MQQLKFEVMDSPSLERARRAGALSADRGRRLDAASAMSSSTSRRSRELSARILGKTPTRYSDADADALGKGDLSRDCRYHASLAPEYGELTLKVDRVKELAFGGMLVVPLAGSIEGRPTFPRPALLRRQIPNAP